jgi:hypothetical protein
VVGPACDGQALRPRRDLRRRGISATIPIKVDQAANRRKKGAKGGRPPTFDPETYKQRHAVNNAQALLQATAAPNQ